MSEPEQKPKAERAAQLTVIDLYEPAEVGTLPSVKIGRAIMQLDTWYMIGGVGPYVDHGPMKAFRLIHRPPEGAPYRGEYVVESGIRTIQCETVPVWRNGRNTFEWRAYVPFKADRDALATLKGTWHG